MAKVITFSQTFPAYHPKAGEKTFFVEKMIEWYWNNIPNSYINVEEMFADLNMNNFTAEEVHHFALSLNTDVKEWKSHTVRVGNRIKPGDMISPRIWFGKPYRSRQFRILPDLVIPKTFQISLEGPDYWVKNGVLMDSLSLRSIEKIAYNDGLSADDFECWFNKDFTGQIICWNDKIQY